MNRDFFTVYDESGYIEMEIYHTKKKGMDGNWMVHFPRFESSEFCAGNRIVFGTAYDVMCLLFAYDEQQAARFYEYWGGIKCPNEK